MSGRTARAHRREVDQVLDELWARIPPTGCKGLCSHSCGPIGMSDAERDRIRRRHGITIRDAETVPGTLDCPALVDERCSIYADRPTVCRLWGACEPMPCPHGCVPEGGRLSDAAAVEILRASIALDPARRMVVDDGVLARVVSDPVGGALMARTLRGDRSAVVALREVMVRMGAGQ